LTPARYRDGARRIAPIAVAAFAFALSFGVLAREGINIQLISTSEIKISVVIEEKYTELAVRALHAAFVEDGAEALETAFRGDHLVEQCSRARSVLRGNGRVLDGLRIGA